ncbi:hypothetical protein N8E89_00580 [Phyllobacterium sp. A18/5-2]|uniref:hypothetical protein n=1 Tax=Phyllobacterium sp. A18/5-2 TaxID=2978392 RepID=UPI0021C692F5|nr:hypothetical protein [Phyllobacterium sp. A18/5-2]UXN64420.1 hypothetical protein N8E89_00580 [Phyllobacterium sp. A18/5-2]
MEARTATPQDLTQVFDHLADRLSREFATAGETENKARENLLMDLREGRGHALRDGNETLAVITWHEVGGIAYTSFAANEEFFTAKTVRFCKRHIRKIQQLCGNMPIRSVSRSDRPDVDRWFALIGFEKVDQHENSATFELGSLQR